MCFLKKNVLVRFFKNVSYMIRWVPGSSRSHECMYMIRWVPGSSRSATVGLTGNKLTKTT